MSDELGGNLRFGPAVEFLRGARFTDQEITTAMSDATMYQFGYGDGLIIFAHTRDSAGYLLYTIRLTG